MTEVDEVRALVEATIQGSNRGEADAHLAMAHKGAARRMPGVTGFVRSADVQQLAPQILSMTKRFTLSYQGIEVIGDTAVLWGAHENVLRRR